MTTIPDPATMLRDASPHAEAAAFRMWERAAEDVTWLWHRAWAGVGATNHGAYLHIHSRRMQKDLLLARRHEERARDVLFRTWGMVNQEVRT